MKKLWKISMLMSLLAIPVMLYLFLQTFGSNEYDVPVYYPQGVIDEYDCDFADGPHFLNRSLLHLVNHDEINPENVFVIYSFLEKDCEDTCQIKFNNLSRLHHTFIGENNIIVISILYGQGEMSVDNYIKQDAHWKFINLEQPELVNFVNCGLVLPFESNSLHQFVLVDKEKRIRGYYDGWSLKETDRMAMEAKILLNNYKNAHEQDNS